MTIAISARDIGPHESMVTDDAALMQRAARGDGGAWRDIVNENLPVVHRIAYQLSLDAQVAEDITQECFLRLWKLAEVWQPKARIRTWLCHVARNLAIDNIRRRKHEIVQMVDENIPESGPDPLEHLAHKQAGDRVNAALLGLPERQRIAIMLVHYGECGGAKAAGIMGISTDAVESLLARARRTLKALLMDGNGDGHD